jgi:hypothetical protein
MIEIDWSARKAKIQIRNDAGDGVLEVEQPLDTTIEIPSYQEVPHTWDGHMIPYFKRVLWTILLTIIIGSRLLKLI